MFGLRSMKRALSAVALGAAVLFGTGAAAYAQGGHGGHDSGRHQRSERRNQRSHQRHETRHLRSHQRNGGGSRAHRRHERRDLRSHQRHERRDLRGHRRQERRNNRSGDNHHDNGHNNH